jgi:hypothetical protein
MALLSFPFAERVDDGSGNVTVTTTEFPLKNWPSIGNAIFRVLRPGCLLTFSEKPHSSKNATNCPNTDIFSKFPF